MSTDSDISSHDGSNSFHNITSYRLGPGDRAVAADRKEQVPLVDPSLDPVLLVLGIGIGDSILEAVDEAGNKELVWVHILAADHECREKLWA
ncbi:hypothetical protein ZWY2020_034001 [Hordeum vulgare]|nr:hypothetical protein ZWY2020_034001 [Hordeum vulgare]